MSGFRPLTRLTARWTALKDHGVEHLTLERHGDRITATGVVTGRAEREPFGAWYRIALDGAWQVKQVSVHITDSRWFIASSRDPGQWLDADGRPLAAFDACIDIDLACTPFTNSLPIRRLAWEPGQSRDFDMVYVDVPTLQASRERQRYTCLEPGRFRFEVPSSGVSCDFAIDRDGLVVDYPSLVKRIG